MDHVLFEAMPATQPRQKRSSTLDAAPPTRKIQYVILTDVIAEFQFFCFVASQIGANLSRERQLMAASGESVGVVTAHRLIRTSLDGGLGSTRRSSSTAGSANTASTAVAESSNFPAAESGNSSGSIGRSTSRIRRGNTPTALEADDRLAHRASAPATGMANRSIYVHVACRSPHSILHSWSTGHITCSSIIDAH
jgi:hypothetical protein